MENNNEQKEVWNKEYELIKPKTLKIHDKNVFCESGTITLDKQGTVYDKEPTPGKSAQKLHVYHEGTRLYDDACITVKKGDTLWSIARDNNITVDKLRMHFFAYCIQKTNENTL